MVLNGLGAESVVLKNGLLKNGDDDALFKESVGSDAKGHLDLFDEGGATDSALGVLSAKKPKEFGRLVSMLKEKVPGVEYALLMAGGVDAVVLADGGGVEERDMSEWMEEAEEPELVE